MERFTKILAVALVTVFVMLSTTIGFAMTKPLAGLKDYDGAYNGTPGTGSVSYNTLWRDNYDGGATSGCNGEGCGKHPGVDIPVASGTNVYART